LSKLDPFVLFVPIIAAWTSWISQRSPEPKHVLNKMEEAATRQHAHPNTIHHCLYGYFHLGYSRSALAQVYNKTERTIGRWIERYETTGSVNRRSSQPRATFTETHRVWLMRFYQNHPLVYLNEAQAAFVTAFNIAISVASVWRIIHSLGLTWKVLERRAIQVN
jgi:transposase